MKINLTNSLIAIMAFSVLSGCGKQQSVAPIMPQQLMDTSSTTTTITAPVVAAAIPKFPTGTKATSIAIDGGEAKVTMGVTKQFKITVKLANNKQINNWTNATWEVANSDIASINNKGILTPMKEGSTKVLASIEGFKAEVKLTVIAATNIWYQVTVPTQQNLNAVKMTSDTEAWTVGDGGTILHYYNGDWVDYYAYGTSPAAGANLTGIDILMDMNEGWAVGDNTILHLINGNWEKIASPAGGTFKAVDAVSQSDAWIAGTTDDGQGLVMRYTGQTWQVIDTPIKGELNSVCALSPNDVWVAGKSSNLQAPNIYHFNGDTWEKAKFTDKWPYIKVWDGKYNIKAIKMINSTQGWAVGEHEVLGSSVRGTKGAFFYFDNVKNIWVEGSFNKFSNANLDQVTLNNIAMLSGNQGWILGNTTTAKWDLTVNNEINGNLLKTDGKDISLETKYQATSIGKSFFGIDILDNSNGIIVGEGGLVMHHQYDISRPYQYSNFSSFNSSYSSYY